MGWLRRAAPWAWGAACLTACGGSFTAPIDDRAPFEFQFSDPAGDTLPPSGSADTLPAVDLVEVRGAVEPDRIRLVLTFGGPVAPWSAEAANSLDGFLDLDLDGLVTTGAPGAAQEAGFSPQVGVEFYVDLRDPRAGRMALIDTRTRTFRLVSARFDAASVTLDIPRDALDPDDGEFRLSVVVGSRTRPVSDVAPNTASFDVRAPASP